MNSLQSIQNIIPYTNNTEITYDFGTNYFNFNGSSFATMNISGDTPGNVFTYEFYVFFTANDTTAVALSTFNTGKLYRCQYHI